MKNLFLACFLAASAATPALVWALPPQALVTNNYCPVGTISNNVHLHTHNSNSLFTGTNCVLGANRLLNVTTGLMQYSEPNNTAPVTFLFENSSTEQGSAIVIRGPEFGFLNLMVPFIVSIKNNRFALNSAIHFHGCLPSSSRITIDGNTFLGNNDLNNFITADAGVSPISFGISSPNFQDPLHFRPNTEVRVENNIITNVQGGMGREASGIRIVPTSFFLADSTKLIVKKNTIDVVGYSTNPGMGVNMKGYINAIPEYEGHHDIEFEFSENVVNVSQGIAWWLPGMWGPRGASDLRIKITKNVGTVNTIVNNEKYAAIYSIINCTEAGSLLVDGNTVTVNNPEGGLWMTHEMISNKQKVAIRNNVFKVNGGNGRFNVQAMDGLDTLDISNNTLYSTNEMNVQFGTIKAKNLVSDNVGISGNNFDARLVNIVVNGITVENGDLINRGNSVTGRENGAAINVANSKVVNGQLRFDDWNVWAQGVIQMSFPGFVDLEDATFAVTGSNFSSNTNPGGDVYLTFANTRVADDSSFVVENNRLEARGGGPHIRFTGPVTVEANNNLMIGYNYMWRQDNQPLTMSFVLFQETLDLVGNANFDFLNNTLGARNNQNFVGMMVGNSNVTVGDEATVEICGNKYFTVTNETLQLGLVAPVVFRERSDCSARVWTTLAPGATTTTVAEATTTVAAATTTAAEATTTTEAPNANETTTAPLDNGAATTRHVVGASLVAAVVGLVAMLF